MVVYWFLARLGLVEVVLLSGRSGARFVSGVLCGGRLAGVRMLGICLGRCGFGMVLARVSFVGERLTT